MSPNTLSVDQKTFNKVIQIDAPVSEVWSMLTVPGLMKKWMMPDIELEIITNWQVGNPITIQGNMNGKGFENTGTVLQFEPEQVLRYSHRSSISRLSDRPESYTVFDFRLQPTEAHTMLALTLSNFPTESIYKHLAFYWNVALEVLKRAIEQKAS